MELKERVDTWLQWYRSWYEIPNDYNKDIISGKSRNGLHDRAMEAASVIKDQQARIDKLEAALKWYADIEKDNIPMCEDINDDIDIGKVARQALREAGE